MQDQFIAHEVLHEYREHRIGRLLHALADLSLWREGFHPSRQIGRGELSEGRSRENGLFIAMAVWILYNGADSRSDSLLHFDFGARLEAGEIRALGGLHAACGHRLYE